MHITVLRAQRASLRRLCRYTAFTGEVSHTPTSPRVCTGHLKASLNMPRFKSRATIPFFGACDSSRTASKKHGSSNTTAARILPRMRRKKQPNGPFLQANPQIFGDQQPGACVRKKMKRLMKHIIPVDSKSLPLSYSIKPTKLPHGKARHSAHDHSSYRSPPPYCTTRSRLLPTLSTNNGAHVAAVMPLRSACTWKTCWSIP